MPSARENALNGLHTALKTLSGPEVHRNEVVPQDVPAGGLVLMNDGDLIETETLFGDPPMYSHQRRAEIEVLTAKRQSADRDAAIDTILLSIETAIAADRTLGGTVDYAELESPDLGGEHVEGAAAFKVATVGVVLNFTTSEELG